jgi:heme O synthase-like polyprenyltransferase
MFDVQQKPTGTAYTTSVAFLVVAFIFIPAILLVSRPLGYVSVVLAAVCGAVCVALAWVNWRKSSQISITSIADRKAAAK